MIIVVKRETRYCVFCGFMINHQMEEMGFSGESEIAFSETEIEAAEQLVQLSEEDTLSCSSGTAGGSVCGCGYGGYEGRGNTKRQEDVVSSEIKTLVGEDQNEEIRRNTNVNGGKCYIRVNMETKRNKKKKFRSLASIYRATKEMTRD